MARYQLAGASRIIGEYRPICIYEEENVSKSNDRQETDFLRASWDMLGDISVNHSVTVGYSLSPTVRRGVFKFRLRAFRITPNQGLRQLAEYEIEFPNSMTANLGACLFRCANQLDHILAQLTVDEVPGEGAKRSK
jgi:hypothetical protein